MKPPSGLPAVPTGADYVGRFAPTPSGPLHFGSLLAAVASYLEARCRGGRWFVRIEDIDPPRERPGAASAILAALDAYGFAGDRPVVYQRESEPAHTAAIARLLEAGLAYHCDCSRKDLVEAGHGPLGAVYPGTCRDRNLPPEPDLAVRVRTDGAYIAYHDRLQGQKEQVLESVSGDFVVRRRDGLVAYQLAVVVDDALQGVTDVVRGIDLMESTPRQVWLQRLLKLPTPGYAHVPVAVTRDGRKLSKATEAAALPLDTPGAELVRALQALGQAPPATLGGAPLAEIWAFATTHWNPAGLCGVATVPAPPTAMAAGQNGLR